MQDCLEDENNVYLVMAFAGEDLFDVLSREGALSEVRSKAITRQVLLALEAAARVGVAHHDLSIENVLLDSSGPVERATLIDWGQCVRAPRDTKHDKAVPIANATRWPGGYGKANSKAPEVQCSASQLPHTLDVYKLDMFAVGVMLFTLLLGFPPWDLKKPGDAKTYRLMTGTGLPRGRLHDIFVHWGINDRVSPEALDLLQALLSANPNERPSHRQALSFPWFEE